MENQRRGPSGEAVDTPRHRALASASRVAILNLVRQATGGLTTQEVATATGLHLTTARDHLDRLAEAGLLVKTRTPADGTPGRPARRYHTAAPTPAPAPYRGLAAALLANLAETASDARAAAMHVGQRWGQTLATAQPPSPLPVDTLVAVLTDLGFSPRVQPATAAVRSDLEIHLPRCPFLELVAPHQEVTCGLHLGMVRGVLDQVGARGARAALEPFGAPTACVIRLSPS